jgi:hypothetical protein
MTGALGARHDEHERSVEERHRAVCAEEPVPLTALEIVAEAIETAPCHLGRHQVPGGLILPDCLVEEGLRSLATRRNSFKPLSASVQ